MNSEVEMTKNESVIFQLSSDEKEIFESENIVEEVVTKEVIKNDVSINIENRFARLKRNLRKRSISIL
jgi:hypothetical protein